MGPSKQTVHRKIVLVGDIHGQLAKLERLWANLGIVVEDFESSKVIFLGDFVDRGPDSAKCLEFLSTLGQRQPQQEHVFIAGNHDFACAAFLGLLPHEPTNAEETHREHVPWRKEPSLWTGPGDQAMHLQGRRWAAGSEEETVFNSGSTFRSYGVEYGDRAGLLAAMPARHKDFLRNLVWMHDCSFTDEKGEVVGVLAMHAGLDQNEAAAPQLLIATERTAERAWIELLQGRKSAIPCHPDVVGKLMASGHHGCMRLREGRLIVDSCGGNSSKILSAVILRGRALATWQIVTEESPSFIWAADAEASRENSQEPVCFSSAPTAAGAHAAAPRGPSADAETHAPCSPELSAAPALSLAARAAEIGLEEEHEEERRDYRKSLSGPDALRLGAAVKIALADSDWTLTSHPLEPAKGSKHK